MRIMTRRRALASVVAAALGATFVVAATAGLERTLAGPAYKVAGKWGGQGTGPGKFVGAKGLAVDTAGNVYVADTDNHRVQMFSATGAFRKQWALDEGVTVPDVAVGPGGEVWATTQVNGTVVKLGGGEEITTPQSAEGVGVDAEGNVYVSTFGDDIVGAVVRYDKAGSYAEAKRWGGLQEPGDVEVAPDGTVYVGDKRGSPPTVKHYDSGGKLLKTIKLQMAATAGAGAQFGIGTDPDCNLWVTNPEKRNVMKYSPSGKVLATATSGDMVGLDVAVGPTGIVYVFDQNAPYSVVRFAEDRAKPATATVGGVTVSNGVAKVKYTLNGVACPSQLSAVASLSGAVKGKASVKVAAGKSTVLSIPVKGTSGAAQFKIVLKTNGRPTTQTAAVRLG
jgi:sugar lactone lactonase YvrE